MWDGGERDSYQGVVTFDIRYSSRNTDAKYNCVKQFEYLIIETWKNIYVYLFSLYEYGKLLKQKCSCYENIMRICYVFIRNIIRRTLRTVEQFSISRRNNIPRVVLFRIIKSPMLTLFTLQFYLHTYF